ncbi:hypothetical protein QR685DRAFT_436792, partial [Neurospora intermedia]
ITTSTIKVEFTNLILIVKVRDWAGSTLNNFNVNLGLQKISRILYTKSSNAKNRILHPNLPARNRYIDIQYK